MGYESHHIGNVSGSAPYQRPKKLPSSAYDYVRLAGSGSFAEPVGTKTYPDKIKVINDGAGDIGLFFGTSASFSSVQTAEGGDSLTDGVVTASSAYTTIYNSADGNSISGIELEFGKVVAFSGSAAASVAFIYKAR